MMCPCGHRLCGCVEPLAIRHVVAGASQKHRPLLEYVPADDPYGIGLEAKP